MLHIAFLTSLLLLNASVNATIFAADSNGNEKNIFYSNESVYVSGNESVTTGSKNVRIYIVSNSDSWTNGTTLVEVVSYITTTTDSTGLLPLTKIWNLDTVPGSYDLVIDTNNDGVYNKSIDFVDNETALGFQIFLAPKPSLAFSLGEKTPPNHIWNYSNTSESEMIQIKVANGVVDAILSSMDLVAGGSGDDRKEVSVIKVYVDSNGTGSIDASDTLVSFGKYSVDNGIFTASFQSGYMLKANTTAYFLITYTMRSNLMNGDNFNFQIFSASGIGVSGARATVSGLPLASATKTIVGPAVPEENTTQNKTCLSYANQSSCSDISCRWCENDSSCRNSNETCPKICRGNISLSLEYLDGKLKATSSGLMDCDNKTVYIKKGSCDNETVISCDVAGSGCEEYFQSALGEHEYYACIDIDENGIFDISEQTYDIISVQQQAEVTREPASEFNYLFLVIPVVIIIVVAIVVYFLVIRKRRDGYENLKEKWRRISKMRRYG